MQGSFLPLTEWWLCPLLVSVSCSQLLKPCGPFTGCELPDVSPHQYHSLRHYWWRGWAHCKCSSQQRSESLSCSQVTSTVSSMVMRLRKTCSQDECLLQLHGCANALQLQPIQHLFRGGDVPAGPELGMECLLWTCTDSVPWGLQVASWAHMT